MTPIVSVLMSCKNSDPTLLKYTINSVLAQTYQNFEFIIVDDGSDRPMESVVREISSDIRIRIFRLEPSGLGAALSFGITQCAGDYIARIDDDDLMSRDRLEKQVAFLDEHQDVCCVGSHRYSLVNNRYAKHRKFPLEHEEILHSLLSLKWSMAHSVLMYRKECVIKAGYYRIKGTGEDLDLILQLSLVGKLANLDDYLLYYRLRMNSLSASCSQLPGHLFALREYKKSNEYPKYSNLVDKSLLTIEKNKDKSKRIPWKRWITFTVIALFGKRIHKEMQD